MRHLLPFLIAVTSLSATAAEPRPNIIVILCDDLGYGDLACYGHPHIKTPNLDRMAREGVRFTSLYSAAPVCSPSRVGLLTGRSPNRAGVYDWIPSANLNTIRPDNRHKVHLQSDEVTLTQMLASSGYATCVSGKWHCNAMFNTDAQAQPDDAGFQHWFATQNNASPSHANPVNYVRNGEPVGALEGFSCLLAVDEAIAWVDERPSHDQNPFFIFLPFHEPHEPVASPPEMVDAYREVSESRDQAEYFANVANVDAAVGKLLTWLEETNRDKNTLVIFTSDNGPETLNRYKSANRSWGVPHPLRGMKLWTTEAGFRVPGIARFPGQIPAGQTVDEPVSSLDFFAIFAHLSGNTAPDDLDGENSWPLFTGEGGFSREKPLLWGYFNAINEERVAMRYGNWKVLAKLDGGELPKFQNLHPGNADQLRNATLTDIEIYQVSEDIAESKNLAQENPEKLAELTKVLETSWAELVTDSPVWQ
ncbi:MAG: sulfatase-like hydrolase/transferase [Verrucomicrobiota bacterium]